MLHRKVRTLHTAQSMLRHTAFDLYSAVVLRMRTDIREHLVSILFGKVGT